jgi:cathepsin A (carboxypeptidase C)
MPWKGQPEFNSKNLQTWYSGGKPAGTFKEVSIEMTGNDSKSQFTFLTVSGAGHLVRSTIIRFVIFKANKWKVPQDKPEVALDMMLRWIQRRKFG